MSSPLKSNIYSCPIDQMFTPEEQENPPPCNHCRKQTNDVFMRVIRQIQPTLTFCQEKCWIDWNEQN